MPMSKLNKHKPGERLNRLKKIFDRIFKKKKEQPMPAWVLQPVRPNNLRGTDQY